MKGGIGNMMKQAQKMQADMQKAQEEIKNMEVEGQSGGGMVKVIMQGSHEVKRISIDDSLLADESNHKSPVEAPGGVPATTGSTNFVESPTLTNPSLTSNKVVAPADVTNFSLEASYSILILDTLLSRKSKLPEIGII